MKRIVVALVSGMFILSLAAGCSQKKEAPVMEEAPAPVMEETAAPEMENMTSTVTEEAPAMEEAPAEAGSEAH